MLPATDHRGHVFVVDDHHDAADTHTLRPDAAYGTSVVHGDEVPATLRERGDG